MEPNSEHCLISSRSTSHILSLVVAVCKRCHRYLPNVSLAVFQRQSGLGFYHPAVSLKNTICFFLFSPEQLT